MAVDTGYYANLTGSNSAEKVEANSQSVTAHSSYRRDGRLYIHCIYPVWGMSDEWQ